MLNYKVVHIGYACSDIVKVIEKYKFLGYKVTSDIIDDKERNVKLVFMTNGCINIEFVQPLDAKSPLYSALKNMKNSSHPYHICYEVENLENAISELQQNKFVLAKKEQPAIAFNNRKVVFLFHKEVGLIELLEK